MVIIAKDSISLEYFDNGKKMSVEIDHDVNSITKYMDHIVHIEEDVTVRDLFKHLGRGMDLIDIVFDASLGGYSFSDFFDEAMLDPEPDELLKYAVFEHKCNMDADELIHEVRFTVIGNHPSEDLEVPYSVELSPINAYTNLVIRIDTSFSINKVEVINDEEVEINLFDACKPMTLFEILSSILFEVSYYGTPDMRKAVFDDMKAQVLARMEVDGADVSAAMIAASKEDDIKDLEKLLEKSINEEDYETSASLRDKINDLTGKGRNKK